MTCQYHSEISDPGVYATADGFVRHTYCEECGKRTRTVAASLSEYLDYQSDRAAARLRFENQKDDGCPF